MRHQGTGGAGRDEARAECLAPRSAFVCHTHSSRSQRLLQDLASVPKHFVIAKIVPVPCSGPGHRAAAVSLNSVSLPAGLSHLRRNKVGIQGKGKLGKIIAGKRLFFHTDTELDSQAHGEEMSLRAECFPWNRTGDQWEGDTDSPWEAVQSLPRPAWLGADSDRHH